MNDNGYVYVLMNPSMENLVKIGKSVRDPKERAKELSSTTGVPTPFVVVYDYYFESCALAENYVHSYLENKGYRVSNNREFFEIPIKEAIDAVMQASKHFGKFIPKDENLFDEEGVFTSDTEDDLIDDLNFEEKIKEPWEDMFLIADTFYYGLGEELQDYEEAMKYYLQSIKLGSVEAYCKIGEMYNLGQGVIENKTKAFQYFKEGAKKGDTNCYAEMGELFNEQENIENALKSWKRYFELTIGNVDFVHAHYYISFIIHNELELKYIDKLINVKNELLGFAQKGIDMAHEQGYDTMPVWEKEIRFIRQFVIDTSENKDSTENRMEIPKPKSIWGKLFN